MGTFVVAVDIGTRRISAAVARRASAGDVVASNVPLGRSTDSAPSAVFVGENDLIFGDAAERRGLSSPDRVLRGVVGRIGEDAPYLVGHQRLMPADVFAATVAWVVDTVREREGADPAAVAVTVPATWADYRTAEVEAALAREGLGAAQLLSTPRAVTFEYETATPVKPGHGVAVYDFGAREFAAVVLRADRGVDGLHVAGVPVSVPGLGGADIDDALLARVLDSAGLTAQSTEFASAPPLLAAALRREVVEAKEALSFDSETVVPVIVGSGGAVRITRGELESIVEPLVERTMDALAQAIESARMTPAEIDAILLIGGSSRIPRIAQMLSERFDRPVVVDADPKAIVALGAARATVATLDAAVFTSAGDDAPGPAAVPASLARRSWLRRAFPGAAAGTAAVILATGIVLGGGTSLATDAVTFALSRSDGDLTLRTPSSTPEPSTTTDPSTAAPTSPPAAEKQPFARAVPRDRVLTSPRSPSAAPGGTPGAATPPNSRTADNDPREPSRPTTPAPAPTTPTTPTTPTDGPPAADPGTTPDDPASPPDEGTTSPPESSPTDPAPIPSDPNPTEPGPPETEPQPDPEPQSEPQPDSSTPPTTGTEPENTGTVS